MKITLDMSLYPLTEEFIPIIKAFINSISAYDGVSISRNNISTQISGEYDIIMNLLHTELKSVFELHRSVFVIKFLAGDKIND
jgi:uncharacterized protein YqgV (UPF0045/DUF77 family)